MNEKLKERYSVRNDNLTNSLGQSIIKSDTITQIEKELLLIKCKHTIEELNTEIEKSNQKNESLTFELREMSNQFMLLKDQTKYLKEENETLQNQIAALKIIESKYVESKEKNVILQEKYKYLKQSHKKLLDKSHKVASESYKIRDDFINQANNLENKLSNITKNNIKLKNAFDSLNASPNKIGSDRYNNNKSMIDDFNHSFLKDSPYKGDKIMSVNNMENYGSQSDKKKHITKNIEYSSMTNRFQNQEEDRSGQDDQLKEKNLIKLREEHKVLKIEVGKYIKHNGQLIETLEKLNKELEDEKEMVHALHKNYDKKYEEIKMDCELKVNNLIQTVLHKDELINQYEKNNHYNVKVKDFEIKKLFEENKNLICELNKMTQLYESTLKFAHELEQENNELQQILQRSQYDLTKLENSISQIPKRKLNI